MCVCVHARTLELVPGVEDTQVCRYGVESAAPDDVHTFVSCLAAVVQLHAFQKLYTPSRKQSQGRKDVNIRPGQIETQKDKSCLDAAKVAQRSVQLSESPEEPTGRRGAGCVAVCSSILNRVASDNGGKMSGSQERDNFNQLKLHHENQHASHLIRTQTQQS